MDQITEYFLFDLTINQKEGTNKFIINLKSYSYYIKRPIIYYLIINEPNYNTIIFSSLTEKRNFDKNKMMTKVEDNGENEIFQTEIEVNIELYDYEVNKTSNTIIIIPVDKETNLIYSFTDYLTDFKYKSLKNNYSVLVLIIVIGILVLIIIIGFLVYRKKNKKKNNNIENEVNYSEQILSNN